MEWAQFCLHAWFPEFSFAKTQFLVVSRLDDAHGEKLLRATLAMELENEIVMLQTGGAFFGYDPILQAIRVAPIPFSQYITAKPTSLQEDKKVVGAPKYLREGSCVFDLSNLAPKKDQKCGR